MGAFGNDRNLLGKGPEELRSVVESLGEPAYRGSQIYHALYAERRFDFAAMTNLPASLRGRLASEASISLPRVVRRYGSSDGTTRYVLGLASDRAGADTHRREECNRRGRLHA